MHNLDLTVILPTYNESENPGFWTLLEQIKNLKSNPIIIVVDDGEDHIEEKLDNSVIYLRGKKGESESIEYALQVANTKYVTIMDSDGSHPSGFIEQSYEFIKQNNNQIIVGSRYCKNGRTNATFINRTISRLSNVFTRTILGGKQTSSDYTGRLLTSTREIFLSYDVWYGRGDSAIALLYNAQNNGIFIKDIPITYYKRRAGSGSTEKLSGIIKYLILYFIRVFSIKLDRYKPFSDRWIERSKHEWSTEDYKISYGTIFINILSIFSIFILQLFVKLPGSNFLSINYPNTSIGFILRYFYWKRKLGYCGQDVLIGRNTEFFNPQNIYIEDRVIIDQNVTIIAPSNTIFNIHSEVTIHSNSYLNVKGGGYLDRKSCIGHSCHIFTHSNLPGGSYSYATRPHEQKIEGIVFRLGKSSFIGTNSVIISSQIEDHTIIGANSFVRENRIITGKSIPSTPRETELSRAS